MGLGIKGPQVEKRSKLDTDIFFQMIGDVTMAKLSEVEAFAKGGSARVQR